MKFKTSHILALTGFAGLAVLMSQRQAKALVGGQEFLVVAEAHGDDETNWQMVADALTNSPHIRGVSILGKEVMRPVRFILTPQSSFKAVPGKTLMQVAGVPIVLTRIHPSGTQEFAEYRDKMST